MTWFLSSWTQVGRHGLEAESKGRTRTVNALARRSAVKKLSGPRSPSPLTERGHPGVSGHSGPTALHHGKSEISGLQEHMKGCLQAVGGGLVLSVTGR